MTRAICMSSAQTIAIVDDDPSVRSGTGCLLRSFGYSAEEFASAEEFLQSDTLPMTSCVITDVKMSGMSGADLQQRLIADGHRFPIIFMTAFPEGGLRLRVLSAGAYGFLTKPCQADALMNCVAAALAV
jgi:FixJ family two-component response regulator